MGILTNPKGKLITMSLIRWKLVAVAHSLPQLYRIDFKFLYYANSILLFAAELRLVVMGAVPWPLCWWLA